MPTHIGAIQAHRHLKTRQKSAINFGTKSLAGARKSDETKPPHAPHHDVLDLKAGDLDEVEEESELEKEIEPPEEHRPRRNSYEEVIHISKVVAPRHQMWVRRLYTHRVSEYIVASLIMGNFIANAAEAQVTSGDQEELFLILEIFFAAAFTVELAINLTAFWWREFCASAWNWFDTLVVIVSILNVSASGDGLPGIGTLRILRAFRVVRLFKRAGSLKKIILAIGDAIPGVMNAFAILMLVMCLYAILAVDLFGPENTAYFGKFSQALFTMFQMMTTEGWADIAREVMENNGDGYAIFFVSFILIANILLANVVIAVLIEKVCAYGDDNDMSETDEHNHEHDHLYLNTDFPNIPNQFWTPDEEPSVEGGALPGLVPNDTLNSSVHNSVDEMDSDTELDASAGVTPYMSPDARTPSIGTSLGPSRWMKIAPSMGVKPGGSTSFKEAAEKMIAAGKANRAKSGDGKSSKAAKREKMKEKKRSESRKVSNIEGAEMDGLHKKLDIIISLLQQSLQRQAQGRMDVAQDQSERGAFQSPVRISSSVTKTVPNSNRNSIIANPDVAEGVAIPQPQDLRGRAAVDALAAELIQPVPPQTEGDRTIGEMSIKDIERQAGIKTGSSPQPPA
eukprot:CAMPEP_0118957174 /NCGR_PEP_ID=MMETSP1169-20130426/61960_1 /TAXON_ID=36882 /ORGANISM="Pyramimonas obovata, Strain CCMP722" /LENGTH=622 /DNA_ID=CAMNT_0006905229 /DNA_START=394 /DNA_END=2262 /DNA_ORIENTATION=-